MVYNNDNIHFLIITEYGEKNEGFDSCTDRLR